jgi:hypothetical protein
LALFCEYGRYTSRLHILKNIKLFLCLIKHHIINKYEGVELELHSFLTSALHRGEWSASRPKEIAAESIGYKVGWTPDPVWRMYGREKSLAACWELISDSTDVWP